MKRLNQHPTQERLRELFDYRDGQLIRKVRTNNSVNIGDVLGTKKSNGYIQGRVDGTRFFVHRLIWIFHFGDIPAGFIVDHKNEIPDDNRIENLQPMSNRKNSRRTTFGKSGEKNIHAHGNGWMVKFKINGKDRYFGRFATVSDAIGRRDKIKKIFNLI